MEIGYGAAAAVRLAEGVPLLQVINTVDPAAWLALDVGVRTGSWGPAAWEDTDGGRALNEALKRGAPLTAAQLAIALCHRNGKVREAALWRAVGYPELLPLVVVRCSDWAPPVREHARRRLVQVLDAEGAVRVMPVVLRVGRRERGDFVVDLATELLRAAPDEIRGPLYSSPDRATRRYAYRLAIAERLLSPAELARIAAARDTDTVVQSLCADAAPATVTDGAYDDVLEPLLGARGPRARAAGVTALRRAGQSERAVGFLDDRAGVVRACARYVVRQGGIDPLGWYRERCGRAESLSPGAVIGLAECGERADGAVLWELTSHPSAEIRTRAVAGLRLLDVVDVRRLRALLDDPAPGVVREATLALLPVVRAPDAEWLTERLAVERPRRVRVSAFRLLQACGGLVRLRSAVAVLDDPDEHLRRWGRDSVQRWQLTADVPLGAPEVGELLDRAVRLFGEHVLRRRKWEAGLKA